MEYNKIRRDMATPKFKIGDRVDIKPNCRGYRRYTEDGIIVRIDTDATISIRWRGSKCAIPYYHANWLKYADNALQKLKKRYGNTKV